MGVPQTAQLKVVQNQLDAVVYAQMNALAAEQHVRVLVQKELLVKVFVRKGVQAAIADVMELVHQVVIQHALL